MVGSPAMQRRQSGRVLGTPASGAFTRLVGRDRVLRQLNVEWQQACAGEFRAALLVGEHGIGKTRVTKEFLRQVGPRGAGLAARAHRLRCASPFGIWSEALDGHLGTLPARLVAEMGGEYLDDLATHLPSVAAAGGEPPDSEPPPARVLAGLAQVLAALSEVTPVVAVLDDFASADHASWTCLDYLAHHLRDSPVLVVLTGRPAELAEEIDLAELIVELEEDDQLRRLVIEPLGVADLTDLVTEVLGEAPSDTLVSSLNERCQGNPLFTLGLLESTDRSAGDPRPAFPQRIVDSVMCRVARLGADRRQLLEMLAVAAQPMNLSLLLSATGQPLQSLAEDLEGLVTAGFLVEKSKGRDVVYSFSHPVLEEAVSLRTGAARCRILHGSIAAALAEAGELSRAAPHLVRSSFTGDQNTFTTLLTTLEYCEKNAAYQEILIILEAMAELLHRLDERWYSVADTMLVADSWVLDHRLDSVSAAGIDALRTMDRLLEDSTRSLQSAVVKLRLMVFLAWGDASYDEAEKAGHAAVALFEQSGDVRNALIARNELAWIHGLRGDFDAQATEGRSVLERADKAGEVEARERAIALLSFSAVWRGYFDEAGALLDTELVGQNCKAGAASERALYLALQGRVREELPLPEAGRTNPERQASVVSEWQALAYWVAGDYRRAVTAASQTVTKEPSKRRAMILVVAALAAGEAAEFTEARRYVNLAKAALGDQEFICYQDCVDWASAAVDLWSGEMGPGVVGLRIAAWRLVDAGAYTIAAFPLADLAEMARTLPDEAEGSAWQLDVIAERTGSPVHRGLALLAGAWISLAAGDDLLASRRAADASEVFAPLECRGLHARALDVLGQALATRDRARAASALKQAAEIFGDCGAHRRRRETLRLLSTLGSSERKSANLLRSNKLTAREREVAVLAAKAWTAGAIAAEFGIGARTVESHLANAYAKLGVSSKTELARRAVPLGLASRSTRTTEV